MDAVMKRLDDEKAFPDGHLLAGDFYLFRLREFDNAEREYEAGEKAFPKSKGIYQRRRVELLALTGKNKEANDLLAQIIKENPSDNDAVQMRAALRLTTGNRDQINLAVNDLAVSGDQDPGEPLAPFGPGAGAGGARRTGRGRSAIGRGHQASAGHDCRARAAGRIYLAKGDAKALKAAEDTLKLDPGISRRTWCAPAAC